MSLKIYFDDSDVNNAGIAYRASDGDLHYSGEVDDLAALRNVVAEYGPVDSEENLANAVAYLTSADDIEAIAKEVSDLGYPELGVEIRRAVRMDGVVEVPPSQSQAEAIADAIVVLATND